MKAHLLGSIILSLLATAMHYQTSIAEKTCDPALATSVTAAMFGHKDHRLILIDVRSRKAFDRCHIPGTLNIALHAIKTKPYLKTKPLVLVNNGYVVGPLAAACNHLNRNGYRASIMTGGLPAWSAKGGRLNGDLFARRDLNHISPQRFHQENTYGHHIRIDASDRHDPQSRNLIPAAQHLALLAGEQGIDRLKSLMEKETAGPFTTLVVFTATGKENQRIQRRLAEAGIGQAFFLHGGWQAYKRHVDRLVLARRPKHERRVRSPGCPTCPQPAQ
jgi:rhodanese-related sulfurtransferase